MERVSLADVETVEAVPGVDLAQLAVGERTSLQHFTIHPGEVVPEHSHHHEQIGFLTEGTATFVVDGEEVVLEAGDAYVIPGGEPHRAENRGEEPVRGVDIFSPPRADPDWMD